jgi:2-C-methyl-D-erythritol 4-phosphate cytidylyltransferase
MTIAALIVAAGRGSRMGGVRPKALLPLGGESILARAVSAFVGHPRITSVVAVVADPEEARAALGGVASRITLLRGGPERHDSVRHGLAAVGPVEIVLVHDAARPLVSVRIIDAVIAATLQYGAAIPVLGLADTVKRLGPDGSVAATVAREELGLAQTPQGFRTDLLRAAYDRAAREGYGATDDAGLVERAGGRVMTVEGSAENLKVTTPADLELAEALLEHRARGGELSHG